MSDTNDSYMSCFYVEVIWYADQLVEFLRFKMMGYNQNKGLLWNALFFLQGIWKIIQKLVLIVQSILFSF